MVDEINVETTNTNDKDSCCMALANDKHSGLGWKHKNRLDMLLLYKPGRTVSTYLEAKYCQRNGIESINIGFFGFTASGKTTIINRLAWLLDRRPWADEILPARQIDIPEYRNESLTTERTKFSVKDGINLIDNRGFSEVNIAVIKEIQRQCGMEIRLYSLKIEGRVKPDTKVNRDWEPSIHNDTLRMLFCMDISRTEWVVHCPVIVHRHDDEREPETLCELINSIYYSTGVFPVVALTIKCDLTNCLKSRSVRSDIPLLDALGDQNIKIKVAQFHQLHCGRVCIIPMRVSSYEEIEGTDVIESSALIDFLFNCCCLADLQIKKSMIYKEASTCC